METRQLFVVPRSATFHSGHGGDFSSRGNTPVQVLQAPCNHWSTRFCAISDGAWFHPKHSVVGAESSVCGAPLVDHSAQAKPVRTSSQGPLAPELGVWQLLVISGVFKRCFLCAQAELVLGWVDIGQNSSDEKLLGSLWGNLCHSSSETHKMHRNGRLDDNAHTHTYQKNY